MARRVSATDPSRRHPAPTGVWQLQEAKARFSQLVRDARASGPQTVTLHGKNAVVVMDADVYDRLTRPPQRTLSELLSNSPLRDLDFEFESVRSPVRDVEL